MKKTTLTVLTVVVFALTTNAQGLKKVYNEAINPIEQIDHAVAKANSEGKFVICQVEEGQGYNQEKVLRFFKNWTPKVVKN